MDSKTETVSADVRIMQITARFDYLVRPYEQLTLEELKRKAYSVPGIMDEPELQELVQIAKHSTIKSVFKNAMGLWWHF